MFPQTRAERATNRPSADTSPQPRRPAQFDPHDLDAKSALRWECSDQRSDAQCMDQQRSHRKDSSNHHHPGIFRPKNFVDRHAQ